MTIEIKSSKIKKKYNILNLDKSGIIDVVKIREKFIIVELSHGINFF